MQEEGLDNNFHAKIIDIDPLSSFHPDAQNLRPCLLPTFTRATADL